MIILQVGIQDEILRLHSMGLLDKLLQDKTSKRHILWCTDAYKDLGENYQRNKEIFVSLITGANSAVIKNRARKALEQQNQRAHQYAEVFTPIWVCDQMNNFADEIWFGRPDRLRKERVTTERLKFTKKKHWRLYVNARILEIACGEAPYLVSRYEVLTGEYIPVQERVGLLDRKLRVVCENATTEEEWLIWVKRAFKATYGYEFQGDNLLIARLNLLLTFEEYMKVCWNRKPTIEEYTEVANIISWNLWQMDGISKAIPYLAEKVYQPTIGESMGLAKSDLNFHGLRKDELGVKQFCIIKNWRQEHNVEYRYMTEGKRKMKFDFVIGNPPYQDGDSVSTRKPPIYNLFMDASYEISDKVELITPARFLFNAGQTPKSWNRKMLSDEHFKVIKYEPNGSKMFPNTDIKGGVAITYRDARKIFGAIVTYNSFEELNSILKKVKNKSFNFLETLISQRGCYRFTEKFFTDFRGAQGQLHTGTGNMIVSNIFNKVPEAFYDNRPDDVESYVKLLGRTRNIRIYKYINRKYVIQNDYIDTYNVFVPEANGSGAIGEVLSTPVIGHPAIGHTDTFLSIGKFSDLKEAEGCLNYVKTKFARTMLGMLKVTQHNPPATWKYVPLQDFTPSSDIDWTKPIAEIDKQLYAKYGLDDKEIEFIETHVKEMA